MEILKQRFGTIEKVITSKTYDDALEEKAQGVITYRFRGMLDEALSDAPKLGSKTEFYPGLILQKRRFSEGENWTDVTLTYYKTEPESTDEETKEPVYSLKTTKTTPSILLHPRYEKATNTAKILGKMLIDGVVATDPIWYKEKISKEEVSIEISSEAKDGFKESTLEKLVNDILIGSDKLGAEMLGKILKGVKEYATNGAEWVETIYKKSLSGEMSGLGKRGNPPGPNPHLDGDWKYSSIEAEKTRSDKLWKIVKTWELSDPGATWDKDLY